MMLTLVHFRDFSKDFSGFDDFDVCISEASSIPWSDTPHPKGSKPCLCTERSQAPMILE